MMLAIVFCGCVTALRQSNIPSQEKLRVQSPMPEKYLIRVADKTNYEVASNGCVIVDVPILEHGCTMYLLGIIKVMDSSPSNLSAIHLNKGHQTVRKFSLNDIAKLPIDNEGYHLVKFE